MAKRTDRRGVGADVTRWDRGRRVDLTSALEKSRAKRLAEEGRGEGRESLAEQLERVDREIAGVEAEERETLRMLAEEEQEEARLRDARAAGDGPNAVADDATRDWRRRRGYIED